MQQCSAQDSWITLPVHTVQALPPPPKLSFGHVKTVLVKRDGVEGNHIFWYCKSIFLIIIYHISVTFDRKIKRSNLNVVISRSRLSTCSCVPIVVPVPPKLLYRLRTGQRSDVTLLIVNVLNSTKSRQIDRSIYLDKANISYSQCDS